MRNGGLRGLVDRFARLQVTAAWATMDYAKWHGECMTMPSGGAKV